MDENLETKKVEIKSKKLETKKALFLAIALIFVVAIVVAILFTRKSHKFTSNVSPIANKEEFKEKFDFDIKDPEGAEDLTYGAENDTIAIVRYKKKVSEDQEMEFVLRSSYSTEDIENSIGVDVEFAYTPIMMTVICDDGTDVQVESKVALDFENDELKYMKALWYDNDRYYSMVTENLVTREDFLQEVNRVIIANHEAFEDSEEETTN